jgi:8-oxo-dGTP diphosphatase
LPQDKKESFIDTYKIYEVQCRADRFFNLISRVKGVNGIHIPAFFKKIQYEIESNRLIFHMLVATIKLKAVSIMNSKTKTNNKIPLELYKRIMKDLPIASVEAVILVNKSVLLLKRKNPPVQGEWWFAGGRIHRGESLEETLHREVKEETRLKITSYKFINVYSRIFPERHDITLAYLCECEGKVKLDSEHSEYKLFRKVPQGLHPYLLEVIKDSGIEKTLAN